jgi:hypothetical protein
MCGSDDSACGSDDSACGDDFACVELKKPLKDLYSLA